MLIGIVAGEASGDTLGAGLIKEVRLLHPECQFVGVTGPQMRDQGCHSLGDIEQLSLFGLFEVLKRLPQVLLFRRKLFQQFLNKKIDLFIGIDAPDFNLKLAFNLKQEGVKTVQYVCPTVWAWRGYRIKNIQRSIDHLLTLFPFEAEYLSNNGVSSHFVGHPIADHVPESDQKQLARKELGISDEATTITVMPGSRSSELKYLGLLFVKTILAIAKRKSRVTFIVPIGREKLKDMFSKLWSKYGDSNLNVRITDGQSHLAIAASDVVLMASGTATLEGLLFKRPMVVAYRMSFFSYQLVRNLLTIPYVSLANLLCKTAWVPEFIQGNATVENLSEAVLSSLGQDHQMMICEFSRIHLDLRKNASQLAAQKVISILNE